MVAQLLRLRLRLLGNSLQRSTANLVRLLIGVAVMVGAAVALAIAVLSLRSDEVDVAGAKVTVLGSLLVLAFLLTPLLYGVTDPMDPRKFSLLGVDDRHIAPGLALAALISAPSLAIVIVALAQVGLWGGAPLPAMFALLGAVLIVASCVLGSHVVSALASFILSTRRSRDVTALLALLVVIVLSPAFVALARINWSRDGAEVLASIAQVVGFTPLGAAWAAAAAAADGDFGGAVVRTLIALAFVGVLWWSWGALVAGMLVTPHGEVAAKAYHGLGWFGRLPATPAGAIAARTLSYWGRDSRYFVTLIIIPIVPLLLILPLLVAGIPIEYLALIPVPVAALFLGWTLHNDVAYDNTAFWLHVVSNTRGVADRFGRAIPTIVVGIPVIVLGSLVSASFFRDFETVLSMLGVSVGILLIGVGLSSIVSARFPYPVAEPGSSPFTTPQSAGSSSSVIQSLSFMGILALSAPTLIFAARGLAEGGHWPATALLTGLGTGVVVLLVGVLWGGRTFDKRATDLFALSMRN